MRHALGDTGARLIAAGIAVSTVGFLSQGMLTAPRVYFAMARDGVFFRSVGTIHERSRAPVVAIVVQVFLAGEGIFGLNNIKHSDDCDKHASLCAGGSGTLDAHRGLGFFLTMPGALLFLVGRRSILQAPRLCRAYRPGCGPPSRCRQAAGAHLQLEVFVMPQCLLL